jgi:3-dehydroquinate synthase
MSEAIIKQEFHVHFSYPVHFSDGLFQPHNSLFADVLAQDGGVGPRKVFFVLDAAVVAAHPQLLTQIETYFEARPKLLRLSGPPLVVAGGEPCKNQPELVQQLLEAVNNQHIDRHSYVVALGGGAVLDLVGYAASVAHRGIRLLRLPTTVLSQNDSGIRVKNSVNAFGKRTFWAISRRPTPSSTTPTFCLP